GTGSLTALAVVLGLPTERTLVDAALFGTGERQTHVLEFEHRLGTNGAHIFDSVLVTDVIGTLDGVVHVPAPVVVRVGGSDRTGDATLGGYSVRTGREHLGDYRRPVTTLGQLQRRAHAGTATTNNDGVIGKSTNVSHESDTPKNLHAPDEHSEHGDATHCLEDEPHTGSPLTDRHVGQVVGGNRPHTNPRMNAQRDESQETEDTHPGGGVQLMPLSV